MRVLLTGLALLLALPGAAQAAIAHNPTLIAPPAMTDPLIIDDVCPGETGWPTQDQQAGRDVKFILPTNRDCTFAQAPENKVNFFLGGTEKNPARNIWWIGGKILAPPAYGETGFPQTDPGTMSWPNGITLKWVKGTAYFEGLHADMRCTCRDVIAAANLGHYDGTATLKGNQPADKTPKIIVVNSILENPLQCTANPAIHGDVIHSQGSGTRPEVWLQNVVFRHGFQGLFLDNSTSQPAGHGATRIQLDHVQIYKRTEVNCQRTEGKAGTTGSVMWNVAPRDGVYFKEVWGVKGATTNPGFTLVNNCATYASSAGVREADWCQGTGPNGDPVTPDRVGRNYSRTFFSDGSEPPPPPVLPVLTIEPIDSVVMRGTAGTVQRVRVKRTGDTSKESKVNFAAIPSGANPASTGDFSPASFPTGTLTFAGDTTTERVFTLQKTWTATATTADYTYYAPTSSAFSISQIPWGAYDMGASDVFTTQALSAPDGYLRMRTVTGPLRVGNGLPKGAPNITFNDHFDIRSAIRPFGNGVWSNQISELKASVVGTKTASTTGAYARALQIHGFRTAYTGSAWDSVSSTDGDTYDIQIRYRTSSGYPLYGGGNDVFRERKQIGSHTWDIYRTNGGWTSDLGMGFVLAEEVESISNVDLKAILDYTLADANARYGRNDTGIYVRGIQAWIEPLSGTFDGTNEGMTVQYNGATYGVQ